MFKRAKKYIMKKLCYNITFLRLVLGFLLSLALNASAAADNPKKPLVMTTTKPLAIIAQSALGDHARVDYIIPTGQSPHEATVTVSAANSLAAAQLVLWLGANFEIRMAKHLQLIPQAKVITALDLLTEDLEQNQHNSHREFTQDPHIWLSPKLANRIANRLQQHFGLPQQAIFTQSDRIVAKKFLQLAQNKNYLFHHDAIGYFVSEFDLKTPLTIRTKIGESRGAKAQYNLRIEARQLGVHCVFVEPQHGSADALKIAEDLDLPIKQLDLQLSDQPLEQLTYRDYINGIATQFNACFE